MAEAIGVASGILAFASAAIKITRTIVELINDIKDAPGFISDLQFDIQGMRGVLIRLETAEKQRLATIASRPGSRKGKEDEPLDEYDTIRDHLKHCRTVLKAVEDELEPVVSKMKGSKKQVVWASVCAALSEKSIKEHSSRLSKAKAELLFTMIIDIRFAVLTSAPNKMTQPAASGSARPIDDPPPEYSDFDPKIKRRNSDMVRDALKGKSIMQRFKPSSSKAETVEEQDETAKQVPTFSQVITSTMENMSKSVASETKGEYNISTFKMLWQYDLERIQSLWDLDKETIHNLKDTINDHMCNIFTTSLSANSTTMSEIQDAAEGTLGWIDTTDEYSLWQDPDNDHKTLILEGKAGSGKSVFTKTLSQLVTKPSTDSTAPILLSYFCNKRVRAKESCVDILKAYVFQYLHENKHDFTTIYKQCGTLNKNWDPAQPDDFKLNAENLLDILAAIFQVSTKRVYCIVDAVDECQDDEDLEKFMARLPILLKSSYGVRFFMSARPDWVADNDLSAFDSLKITLSPDITEKDISQVIELELCRLQSKLTIDMKEKLALKKKLVGKAEGMMLWVVLAFRRIQERIKSMLSPSLKWLEKMVDKLPREIFGMYDHIMASIREKYGKTSRSPGGAYSSSDEDDEDEESSNLAIYGKLVLWVARAARPLTVKELQFALALDLKDECLDDMKKKINRDIERVVGRIPFLEIISAEKSSEASVEDDTAKALAMIWLPTQASAPSATVRFIHQSAKEYILKSADPSSSKKGDDTGFTYPKLDDACIGNLCINFLSFRDFDNGPIREFKENVRFLEGFKKFMEEYGFLEYSSSYWAYHFNLATGLDESTKARVADWICNRKNNIRVWFQVMNFAMASEWTDFIDGEFGLLAAAGSGIEWLTDYLIEKGHDVNQRDDYGRTPYMLASWRGYDVCAQKLVDAGASTDDSWMIRFPGEHDALIGMIGGGEAKEVVEYLENAEESEIHNKDDFGRTAIFYACARGDLEILTALLEKNPALDVKDKYGRLPIDVTLDSECRELILERMKKKKIKCTADMTKKISCLHNMFDEGQGFMFQTLYCGFCGIALHTFYFHCCECSLEDHSFDACKDCWDKGKHCLDASHKPAGRVTADFLVSSLEYTPHMVNAHVESPIKWSLDGDSDEDEEESSEDEEIGPVGSGDQRTTPEKKTVTTEKAASKGQSTPDGPIKRVPDGPAEEKGAGCKCVIL